MTRAVVVTVLLSMAALLPGRALADDASEAQLQYELGAELYQQRRYSEALERFLASNRLVPNKNVVFNIAQVYGLLGRHREAFNWYESFLTEFDVTGEDRAEAERAQAREARRVAVLDVRTTPPDATLYVDRVDLGAVGRSPRRIAVEPGQRTVIARVEGYRDARSDVDVSAGGTTPVELSLEPILGTLEVSSDPGGAVVFVEGASEPLGTTPFSVERPVGPVRLIARREGFVEQPRSVRVRDGEVTQVTFELVRAAADVAVLSVVTSPSGAVVRLDGETVGEAPLTLGQLPPGARRLTLEAEGREGWETEVLLEPGSATRVDATLVDPSDRPWDGWRWIGYGSGAAAVVAGVVVGIVAAGQRSAFFDDPNPTAADHDRVQTLNLTADLLMGGGVVVLGTTFILDLLSAPAPESTGTVEIGR